MKKLLVTVSLFTLFTTLLMADLSPEYSADVNSLKADNFSTVSKKSKKQTKKDEKQTKKDEKSLSNFSRTKITKSVPVYSQSIKVTKVLAYSDITNYSLSHKLLKTKVVRGSVKKSYIITLANQLKATRVLVFVQSDIRYIYFYAN
jgi:hypothetical protein